MFLSVPVHHKAEKKPEQTLIAYCDESSTTKNRYAVMGAIYFIPKFPNDSDNVVRDFESELTAIKKKHGLENRLKWARVPSPGKYLEGYKEVLRYFLDNQRLFFRCIVIDTSVYRFDHPEYCSGDPMKGFIKFYCVFLTDGLMRWKTDYYYDIRVDKFGFKTGCDSQSLQLAVQGRYKRKYVSGCPPQMRYCGVAPCDSRSHNILQLADLLVGSVAFVWNRGMQRKSKKARAKQELVKLIQGNRKIDLSKPTSDPDEEGFNIWAFRKPEHN